MEKPEQLISLSDPGEVDRHEHTPSDRAVIQISNVFAWLFPILMLAICAQVVLRQSGMNQAWLDDLQWWLYGMAVLVGIGYAVTTDSHVRVDIFYDRFPTPRKLKVDIFALVWMFLPFILLSWDVTLGYAIVSVEADEGSTSPNGLNNLWMLKVFMNVSFLFIAFATWAAYRRRLAQLTEPTLFRTLLYAFPSVMFAINLASYYAIWWALYLTRGPEEDARDIGRRAIFDEFELGAWELRYTIVITLVLTLLVIGLARLADRNRRTEG